MLFFTIEFPESLTPEIQQKIQGLLPPPLNVPKWKEDDSTVEIRQMTDIDPVQSYYSNKGEHRR